MDWISVGEFWTLISEKLDGWIELSIKQIPNVIVALVIILLTVVVAKIVSSGVRKVLHRSLESRQIADLLTSIFRIFLLGVGVFIALDFVGLKGTVTSLLAGAGIIGLALGFAFQDMTENLIAGISMSELKGS